MLDRLKRSRVAQVLGAYGQSQASNYASGLALNAFLAMFPLILGILAIAGVVIHDPSTEAKLYQGIESVFPKEARGSVANALSGVKHSAGLLGIFSVVGLLWSGSSLFASMEFALTKIFDTKQRDMLRQRLMGVVMMLVFVFAIVLSVTANSAAAASPGGGVLGALLGALVLVGLMTAIYRFVPNRTFPLKEIWPGAVLAGVLVELFSLVFPLYAKISHNFGTYGQQFGLFFLLATWLVFMSQFILLGAVFNKVRLGTPRDEGVIPSSAADSRAHTEPADAIASEQRGDGARAPQAGGGATGRRPLPLQPYGPAHVAAAKEARAALGLWAAAALVNSVLSRVRGGPRPRR